MQKGPTHPHTAHIRRALAHLYRQPLDIHEAVCLFILLEETIIIFSPFLWWFILCFFRVLIFPSVLCFPNPFPVQQLVIRQLLPTRRSAGPTTVCRCCPFCRCCRCCCCFRCCRCFRSASRDSSCSTSIINGSLWLIPSWRRPARFFCEAIIVVCVPFWGLELSPSTAGCSLVCSCTVPYIGFFGSRC